MEFYWDRIIIQAATLLGNGFAHGMYALAAGIALSGFFRAIGRK